MKKLIPLLFLLPLFTACQDDFKETCEAMDPPGVVKEDTKTVTTTVINPTNGQAHTGVSTVTNRFCVQDGKIVAVS